MLEFRRDHEVRRQSGKERDHLPFEIDGLVIKVDLLKYHELSGVTGKARYAVAYKFAPEQAVTKVTEITVQVGGPEC